MRLIDADALVENHFPDDHNIALSYSDKCWMRRIIQGEPTVDPVKHGEWIEVENSGIGNTAECSVCGGNTYGYRTCKYCPDCGAKMDGGNDDER